MRRLFILLLIFIAANIVQAQESIYDTKIFRHPPMKYRPIPLWFWNNTTINSQELEYQLEKMITQDGYGGCAILPFGQNFQPFLAPI